MPAVRGQWNLTWNIAATAEVTALLKWIQTLSTFPVLLNRYLVISWQRVQMTNTIPWIYQKNHKRMTFHFSLHTVTGSSSDWWGPKEVSSSSPCPEQSKFWTQTRLLRASRNQGIKPPRMEIGLAPPLGCPCGSSLSLSCFSLCRCLSPSRHAPLWRAWLRLLYPSLWCQGFFWVFPNLPHLLPEPAPVQQHLGGPLLNSVMFINSFPVLGAPKRMHSCRAEGNNHLLWSTVCAPVHTFQDATSLLYCLCQMSVISKYRNGWQGLQIKCRILTESQRWKQHLLNISPFLPRTQQFPFL